MIGLIVDISGNQYLFITNFAECWVSRQIQSTKSCVTRYDRFLRVQAIMGLCHRRIHSCAFWRSEGDENQKPCLSDDNRIGEVLLMVGAVSLHNMQPRPP